MKNEQDYSFLVPCERKAAKTYPSVEDPWRQSQQLRQESQQLRQESQQLRRRCQELRRRCQQLQQESQELQQESQEILRRSNEGNQELCHVEKNW